MAYYRDPVAVSGAASDQYLDVFAEFDFSCSDDSCDFFCPDCRNISRCSMYSEVMADWEWFYS